MSFFSMKETSSRGLAFICITFSFMSGMDTEDLEWLGNASLHHSFWGKVISFLSILILLGFGILSAVELVRRADSAHIQKE